jgi:hypothetical protein
LSHCIAEIHHLYNLSRFRLLAVKHTTGFLGAPLDGDIVFIAFLSIASDCAAQTVAIITNLTSASILDTPNEIKVCMSTLLFKK